MNFFDEIALQDHEILKGLDSLNLDDYQKVLELHAKRIALYSRHINEIQDPVTKELLYLKKDGIILMCGVIQARHDLQGDTAKIISRLDDLEAKVQSLSQDKSK
ncbi:MAG: hypothetical protein WCE93_04855 [Nitrososphaeraceae archaeon]